MPIATTLALWSGGIMLGRYLYREWLYAGRHQRVVEQKTAQKVKPTTTYPLDEEIRVLDRDLAMSCTGMVSVAGATVFPPLSLIAIPCVIIPTIPLAQQSWEDLRKKKRISLTGLNVLATGVVLVSGYVGLCAVSLSIFLVGKRLSLATRRQAHTEIAKEFVDKDEVVWVLHDGVEVQIPLANLQKGDTVVVRAGLPIACDGTIEFGTVIVDQSKLTGESTLVEKVEGDQVFAATLVISGRALIRVECAGSESIAARLTTLISGMASYEQTIESDAGRMSDASVPPTVAMVVLGLAVSGITGAVIAAWSNCIKVFWVATPVATLGTMRTAAQYGILIKDGRALDLLGDIDTVVFDKTGTLTQNSMKVVSVYPVDGATIEDVLGLAAKAEQWQEHPVAQAIVAAAREAGVNLGTSEVEEVVYDMGLGLKVELLGCELVLGSRRMMERIGVDLPSELDAVVAEASRLGHSIVYVAFGGLCSGCIILQSEIRPEAAQVIQRLHARGIKTLILSGDDEGPTAALATTLGIQTAFAHTLPEGKAARIQELQKAGHKVCFVGDGVNDTLAMRVAEVSVAVGGGSALAMDSAQIILRDGSLEELNTVFALGQRHTLVQSRILDAAIVPTIVSFGGALFAGVSLPAVTGIYAGAMTIGLAMALQEGRGNHTENLG